MPQSPTLQRLRLRDALFGASVLALLVGGGFYFERLSAGTPPQQADSPSPLQAGWAPPEVRRLARQVVDTADHRQRPFLVVDKAQAQLFAFDARGLLRASTPVLLGAARSDAADEPAATPAGRFAADPRQHGGGMTLQWMSGEVLLALHAPATVLTPGQAERRFAAQDAGERRISDGSLHVPEAFFRQHLMPLATQASMLYVLPESAGVAPGPVARAPS